MSMFLSRDELIEMSDRKQSGTIIAWLREKGYRFEISACGWPKVMRAAVEAKLMPATNKAASKKSQPDFSAYVQTKKAA